MLRLISHRGNLEGKIPLLENSPHYIDDALDAGFDVEVDIWVQSESIYLGHDSPVYKIYLNWLKERSDVLWIHCKNLEAFQYLNSLENSNLNYFFHDADDATLTSKGYMWVYPGKQPIKGSIAVLPEIHKEDVNDCWGVCSDKIVFYKKFR